MVREDRKIPVPSRLSRIRPATIQGKTVMNDGTSNFGTPEEARLELQMLKLKKRELQLQKKGVNAKQTALRSNYTHQARNNVPMVRGRGLLPNLFRAFQRNARHADRFNLAANLSPLTRQSEHLSAHILHIDARILELECYLLKFGGRTNKVDRNASLIGNPVERGRPRILG